MSGFVDPRPALLEEYEEAARRLREVTGEPTDLAERIHLWIRLRSLRRSILSGDRRTARW